MGKSGHYGALDTNPENILLDKARKRNDANATLSAEEFILEVIRRNQLVDEAKLNEIKNKFDELVQTEQGETSKDGAQITPQAVFRYLDLRDRAFQRASQATSERQTVGALPLARRRTSYLPGAVNEFQWNFHQWRSSVWEPAVARISSEVLRSLRPSDVGQTEEILKATRDELNEAEAERAAELKRMEITFFFLTREFVLSCRSMRLPCFQDLKERRPDALVQIALSESNVLRGDLKAYANYLAVSHRWEHSEQPDRHGKQLSAIQQHLRDRPHLTHVWYDWCGTAYLVKHYYTLNLFSTHTSSALHCA